MKVKDLINFLQTLNQENELLFADYYYDSREGFIPWNNNAKIELYIVSPKKTETILGDSLCQTVKEVF